MRTGELVRSAARSGNAASATPSPRNEVVAANQSVLNRPPRRRSTNRRLTTATHFVTCSTESDHARGERFKCVGVCVERSSHMFDDTRGIDEVLAAILWVGAALLVANAVGACEMSGASRWVAR